MPAFVLNFKYQQNKLLPLIWTLKTRWHQQLTRNISLWTCRFSLFFFILHNQFNPFLGICVQHEQFWVQKVENLDNKLLYIIEICFWGGKKTSWQVSIISITQQICCLFQILNKIVFVNFPSLHFTFYSFLILFLTKKFTFSNSWNMVQVPKYHQHLWLTSIYPLHFTLFSHYSSFHLSFTTKKEPLFYFRS